MSDNTKSLYEEVTQTLNDFTGDADDWGTKISDLGKSEKLPVTSETRSKTEEITADLPVAPEGLSYVKPVPEPVKPDINYDEPDKPGKHTISGVEKLVKPNGVVEDVGFDWDFSTYEPGPKPELKEYTAPDIVLPSLGTAPDIEAPDRVTLHSTSIPTFEGINEIDFSITINPALLPGLTNQFNYNEDPYSMEIADEILVELRAILNGRTAIPSWIWDGFWEQGAGKIKRQENAEIYEARYNNAILGWSTPSTIYLSAVNDARQKAFEAISALTKENVLNQATAAREDFKDAIERGIAIEQMLINANSSRFERLLKSAIEANNAGIEVYKAAVQAYQIIELQAKELLVKLKELELKGELSKVDVFEAEIKAAGFILDYDKNQVELYKAQWEGEDTKAKAYAAYADAIKSYALAQQAAVDAFGKQVDSNNTILQGWVTEWDAYLKRLEPNKYKIQAHEARNSLFANRVQYYQAQGKLESDRVTADVDLAKLGLDNFKTELERFKTLWDGINTKIDALTKIYQTDATVYTAKSQAETSRVNSLTTIYESKINAAKLALTAKIETAKDRLAYHQTDMDSWNKWQSSLVGAYSQLGASAYSAANISLQASSSVGYNYGRSYQEQLQRSGNVNVSAQNAEAQVTLPDFVLQ